MYDITDLLKTSEFMVSEVEDHSRKLGYIEGRNYLMDALLDEYKAATPEVKEFIFKFIRKHSDLNVEVL